MSANTAAVRRHRERHPDRARLQSKINHARDHAARELVRRHPEEFEEILGGVLADRDLPRYLPPLLQRDGRRAS